MLIMVNKRATLVASLLLITPVIPANAQTVSAVCTKAGAMKLQNGTRFTCVRSGKNLVWRKSPSTSKTSPPPSTSTTTTIPSAPTSFANLVENFRGISYAAWLKSREKIVASNRESIEVNVVVGPNSTLNYKSPQTAFALVSRLFAGYTRPTAVDLLGFSYKDRDWAVQKMDELMPNKGSGWIYDVACPSPSNCGGGGAFSDGSDKFLIVIGVDSKSNNSVEGTLEAHEFTHVIQQSVMRKGNPWPLYDPWPPTWFWEGQAEFAQNAAMWFESFDMYTKRRRDVISELLYTPSFDRAYIESFFVVNGDDAWRKKHGGWRQYDLGSMFVEILTSLKGPDSTMEMWKLAQTGVGFAEAFKRVYGTSLDAALPIMAQAIALQLGR
jgi:hypothetical protein